MPFAGANMLEAVGQTYIVSLRAVIGEVEVPVIACAVDYELNAVPRCHLKLAVGADQDGNLSPVHEVELLGGQEQAPAQVFATLLPSGAGDLGWPGTNSDLGIPEGEFLLFDGRVESGGDSNDAGSADYTIHLEHWLAELGDSSVFSHLSHPANPLQYSYGAVAPVSATNDQAQPLPFFESYSLAFDQFSQANVTSDLWGEAILPYLRQLAEADRFDKSVAANLGIAGVGANTAALEALQKIKASPKLALGADPLDNDLVVNLARTVAGLVGNPAVITRQTFWDLLVGTLGSEFQFALVPRIKDALIVPFVAGLRTSFVTLPLDEIGSLQRVRPSGRRLLGLGLLVGPESATGFGATPANAAAAGALGIGGYFQPQDQKTGQVLFYAAPGWTDVVLAPQQYAEDAAGMGDQPIPDAINPAPPGGQPQPGPLQQIAPNAQRRRTLLNALAQSHYAAEALRNRQAIYGGPFRLDIAPGATVQLQSRLDPNGQAVPPSYATVVRVSLHLDGQRPYAGCGLHLTHIRSQAENGSDATSIAAHPLYIETFSGAPLYVVGS